MNFDARLRKLEQQRKNSGLPGVLILYQFIDGSLQDSSGAIFTATIPEHCLVVRYICPNDARTPSSRHLDPAEWSAQVSAEEKVRNAAAVPPRPQAEPQALDMPEPVKADHLGYETRRPRSTQSAVNQSKANREFFGRAR